MREHLIELESILVKEFKPTFLSVHYEHNEKNPFVHIVISARPFSSLPVEKRVAMVYQKLLEEKENFIMVLPIIVEAFSSSEMVEIFEHIR